MDEQTNPQPTNNQNDDTNFRELAIELLMTRYPYAKEGEPQLLLGELPPNFPGDIPFSAGSHLVGSLVADQPIVILNTSQADEAVITFYEEQLTAAGWVKPEPSLPERHGGFLESGHSAVGKIPRQGTALYRDDGSSLHIAAYGTPGGHTRVQLTLKPNGARELRHMYRAGMHHPEIYSVLPPIEPPPNSRQSQGGASAGSDRVEMEGHIESDLDLPTLAAHYVAQLEQGDWQRTVSGENDLVAWSTWTFTDEDKEPWRALFIILKRPDEQRLFWLHLIAEWTDKSSSRGDGGKGTLFGWQSLSQPSGS